MLFLYLKKSNENTTATNVCMIELFFMTDMGTIANHDNKIKNIWLNVTHSEHSQFCMAFFTSYFNILSETNASYNQFQP